MAVALLGIIDCWEAKGKSADETLDHLIAIHKEDLKQENANGQQTNP